MAKNTFFEDFSLFLWIIKLFSVKIGGLRGAPLGGVSLI